MITISYTAKEDLGHFKFAADDVLAKDQAGRQSRAYNLLRAERLGNAFHGKVRIVFCTTDEERSVETTVWAASDDYVNLKGGITLPVRAISRVEFA